ncbi:hypothetical protein PTTW11_10259 [Pyrenophora teres f. teres]|uniref:Uncharacterized protein n=1 Tax=Pyrenophora teres f. teres TaxID=97479 RepID=A0A6S6WF11_9PLEO|nr:hypothetical protein PTTW11_10259 [Pyrenophora teres f. teres]
MQAPSQTLAQSSGKGPMRDLTQPLPTSAQAIDDVGHADVESLKHFPIDLPNRLPRSSRWSRFWHHNIVRVLIGILCFLASVGGTVGGAYFVAELMRKEMFRQSWMQNLTTVQVTQTQFVTGLHLATETLWDMQSTVVSTSWASTTPTAT